MFSLKSPVSDSACFVVVVVGAAAVALLETGMILIPPHVEHVPSCLVPRAVTPRASRHSWTCEVYVSYRR